jgi:hypothetical protein
MFMNLLKLLFAITILSSSVYGNAQDTIYTKNHQRIICKITSTESSNIVYSQPTLNSNVSYTIDKGYVTKVVFENGNIIEFDIKEKKVQDYTTQRKNILKFDYVSTFTGKLCLGYERSLGLQKSFEFNLGIIGLGTDLMEVKPKGAYIQISYKFIKDPDFYLNLNHYAHVLKGFYLKPELSVSMFSRLTYRYSASQYSFNDRENYSSAALILNFGKQWVIDDRFSISINAGLGYGFAMEDGYYYSHVTGGPIFPIAASVGTSIGFLF